MSAGSPQLCSGCTTPCRQLADAATALHAGDLDRISMQTRSLLDITTENQLGLLAVDGVEIAAADHCMRRGHDAALHAVPRRRGPGAFVPLEAGVLRVAVIAHDVGTRDL